MKFKNFFWLLCLPLLQSCGGGGDLSSTGDISALMANNRFQTAITDFTDDVQSEITNQNDIIDPSIQPLLAVDYGPCTTFIKGSSLADKEYKVEYKCKDLPDAGATYTKQGTFSRNLVDPLDLSLGFLYEYDLYLYNTTNTGTYYETSYKGFHSNKKTSTKLSFEADYSWEVSSDNYKPIDLEWSWRRKFAKTYTPDDMSNPMNAGKLTLEGYYKVSGKLGPDQNQKQTQANFTLEAKSKDLVYDTTCAKFFKSGSIYFYDGSQNEIEVRYSCNDIALYLNGKEFDS